MKIFYLITKSEIGGAQVHVYQLSKYFVQKGDEVAIMSYPGGWLEKEAEKFGVKFYPNKDFSNAPNFFKIFRTIKKINKGIEDFKPDLIACHSTIAGFWGRLTIRNKIPTIFTAHGWAFTVGVSIWRKYLAILIEKIAGKFCSKMICVSDFDRNLALKYKIVLPKKITVIHNGAEPHPCRETESRDAGSMRIVFIGRLAKPKDPLLLLKSFNNLSPELQNKSEIFIVGEGPKRRELERFIKENKLKEKVKLLGAASRENVFEILKKSDIFVLISNWEGFPYTIIEAMSYGLPVIASDVGGVREAINNDCGILVKRGDKKAIKNALEKLLKNPSLAKEMGEKSRARVKKEFSLEKTLRETEQIYKEILRG